MHSSMHSHEKNENRVTCIRPYTLIQTKVKKIKSHTFVHVLSFIRIEKMKNIAYIHVFVHSAENMNQLCPFQHSHDIRLYLIYLFG